MSGASNDGERVQARPQKKIVWRSISLGKSSELSDSVMELTTSTKEKMRKAREWDTIVTIVLVDAKDLLPLSEDGYSHSLYCKFRLGSETFKSKNVSSKKKLQWRERFDFRLSHDTNLNVSLWDRGKQKNFMGSCVIDLSKFEKERTHDVWQELDNGFGLIHLSITMCVVRDSGEPQMAIVECKEPIYRISNNWKLVGALYVTVYAAKGLTSKPNAHCILEVDNERVQTPRAGYSVEPRWNKSYVFNVYDVSSTLDVKLYDSSSLLSECIGKISIPLLRINNDEMRWYALKDRNRKHFARGNFPRILLQMTLVWDPLKATLRLFRPKEVKYIKKSPKFDVGLIYSNIEVIATTFIYIAEIHEQLIQLFEWDDMEISLLALIGWILFCHFITLWAIPLLLLLPFLYFWITNRHQDNTWTIGPTTYENDKVKEEKLGLFQELQIMTITITNSIEFIVTHLEKLYNLVTFKVPFLSYVVMMLLVIGSIAIYLIPFNYMLMAVGIYKFTRKYLNPNRIMNNDLLDFFSRIPDNNLLEEWKELSVPEPNQDKYTPRNLNRSLSTSI